jgi:hypothetical protein
MKRLAAGLGLVFVAGVGAFWLLTEPRAGLAPGAMEAGGDPARGEIVFNAGGCASCHASPGQDDSRKLGGGLALKTEFGTFVVPNISPDLRDGIGGWTTADLANAMLRGVSPGGQHYYPAFPYTTYAHATLGDVRDLMAYLRNLPSVAGKTAGHDLAFPFNIRRGIGLWKALYLDTGPVAEDPARSAGWNRGRYLVEALGHCAECHSPRNALGAIIPAQRFAGGRSADGDGFTPNISGKIFASWSQDDIVEMLETGLTPDDKVAGAMAEVVKNTARLPKADRDAMAEYLKSLPAVDSPPRPPKKD